MYIKLNVEIMKSWLVVHMVRKVGDKSSRKNPETGPRNNPSYPNKENGD